MNGSANKPQFLIRPATEQDTALILSFIRELADYEKLLHEVAATEEILHESLFVRHQAQVAIAEENGIPVGFALFFENFSTFLGKANLYLEDLYIKPECRGRGYGEALFRHLGQLAAERGYERIDWWCLDWNKSSIQFYEKMGADAMSDWTVYRMQGKALEKLAGAKE